MKKELVVLINPGHDDEVAEGVARSFGAKSRDIPREDPPISIINLGAFIRDHGFDVRILDTHVESNYKDILRSLIKEKPLAIGLSVMLGKFTKNAISLTKFIKDIDSTIPVIWGGKLIHLAKDMILQETSADYIVIGDGEFPLLALLKALTGGSPLDGIEGLGYRQGSRVIVYGDCVVVENLDDIYQSKDFGWDLVKEKINFKQVPYFINLYTSRGCRFNCSFCYLMDIKEMKPSLRYRRRSVENVIREIKYLKDNFGINVFTFGDDDFLYNIKEITPVLNYFKENGLYIEHFWTNINNLTPETISILKGICQTVCYSIETTSPRLQKVLNKRIPIEKVLSVNKLLRDVRINVVHNFLFGIPTEKDEDTKQNIDLMKEIKKINPYFRANCYILSPIPGTPIFEFGKSLAKTDIQWTLDDLCNYHFRYMNKSASKFRPYLSEEDNAFYERVTVLANELFTEINVPANESQRAEIKGSKRLSYIFGDIDEIQHPADKKKKYILNEVIRAVENNKELPKIGLF
jgi:radical SAM superfamily enzyme YgiQ (UPF0313 family)